MTDADYAAWLAQPSASRVLLAEVGLNSGGSETTLYVATREFTSRSTDTPASTTYDDRLGGLVVQENLGIFAEASTFSVGDVSLENGDRGVDWLLGTVAEGRSVVFYFGDTSWPKSDFRVVYSGSLEGVPSAPDSQTITIRVADKMSRLDEAISEVKLGGTTPNADALLPLCFGECHNVTPLLTDPTTLEYAVHVGAIEAIIEVRDNGVPVNYTPNLAAGRFNLTTAPVGAITASVQGDKLATVYANDVGTLVQRLVTSYGRADRRLVTADLDTSSLSSFTTANTQPVGLYATASMTVREACNALAASVGAKLVLSRTGLLRLVQIAFPAVSTASVDLDDISGGDPRIVARPQVAAACKLAYCRNWTVQKNLQSGIPAQHQELYGQEWLTSTKSDATTAALYKLPVDTELEPSLLLRKVDADAEATRRLNLRKTQRTVYQFKGGASQLAYELGQGVDFRSSLYGLSASRTASVVSLSLDWGEGTVDVGVIA